jgi:CBS domain-containing protein
MLSDLLRYHLGDAQGQRARLLDLALNLAIGDYPAVTGLIYLGPDKQPLALPWDAVVTTDWGTRRLQVADLQNGHLQTPETLQKTVLIQRDVMDALVLDLEHRQATRANDLWLRQEADGRLLLRGADVSPWAVLRRLGHGLLGRGADRQLVDWRHVEFLRGDPAAARAGHDYHRRVAVLPPVQVARLVDAVPYLHAAELLTLIPDPVAADALEAMRTTRQVQVFEELDDNQTLRLLALMAPDAATDLVGRLDPDLAERLLNGLPNPQRERVLALLRYPEDTAGGIMTNDMIVVPGDLSVEEARRTLRAQLADPDFVYYVYVVDAVGAGRLRGVLTLRDLLRAEDTDRLEEVMQASLITIDPLEPAAEAARRVADNHLDALPVIAADGRLLGVVTVDAAITLLAPPAWREQGPGVFA